MLFLHNPLFAQVKDVDTTPQKSNNIFNLALKSITLSKTDSAREASVINISGEAPFMPYKGRIIRHIIIQQYGFERTFSDTTKGIHYWGTKILNKLHRNTRSWVIKDNLFIKENTNLNPYV